MEDFDNIALDPTEVVTTKVEVTKEAQTPKGKGKKKVQEEEKPTEFINPLKNERITVKYIAKRQGIWGTDPKHVLAGGMADNAKKTYVVPVLSSGMYVNVLTNSEKAYLEQAMGLEPNAMSIYRKHDNFWDSSNSEGINKVVLTKQDNYLDLSNPEDYIKYKILLANKNRVAPSMEAYKKMPLASYEYVILRDEEETKTAKNNMNATMQAYVNLGKISENKDKMILVIETITGRPVSNNSKLDTIQTALNSLIQANPVKFNATVEDEYLDTKVIIRKAVLAGIIAKRGTQYYYKNGVSSEPLCDANQNPTFNNAAIFLNSPKNQELLMTIQARVEQ